MTEPAATSLAGFSPEALAAIAQRLNACRADGITILFAIESGSRAWGFPSPDSDYDCRFIYARPIRDHLSLRQHRDVIEFPIEGEIDTGGWDLRKALLLAVDGNAAVVEWAKSPHVYEEIPGFRAELIALFKSIVPPRKVAHHYLGLAKAQIARIGDPHGAIRLKKLFYVIRPVIALDWLSAHDDAALPPMNMPQAMRDIALSGKLARDIDRLIADKAMTRELGDGTAPTSIIDYVHARLAFHEEILSRDGRLDGDECDRYALAEAFYRRWVRTLEP